MTGSEAARWDVTNFASKDTLLQAVREEAGGMLALAKPPENWLAPTASGHWQVRDIIGHMVDVTEGYLDAFRAAREGRSTPEPFGLRVMAERLDEHAQAFRPLSQATMLGRLRADMERMMTEFQALEADDWTGFLAPHPYLGPIPAFVFATFHLVDYAVHSWDIREGLKLPNVLSGTAADLLAPIMFILWQGTAASERLSGDTVRVGIRVSGRNGGLWQVTAAPSGYSYEQRADDGADLPAIIDFDPASLILTAYGRIRGGTAYGDKALAERYLSLFFAI